MKHLWTTYRTIEIMLKDWSFVLKDFYSLSPMRMPYTKKALTHSEGRGSFKDGRYTSTWQSLFHLQFLFVLKYVFFKFCEFIFDFSIGQFHCLYINHWKTLEKNMNRLFNIQNREMRNEIPLKFQLKEKQFKN